MTTAHKPTYHPAVGGSTAGNYRYHAPRQQFSSRDLAAHTQLKFRAGYKGKGNITIVDPKRQPHSTRSTVSSFQIYGEEEEDEQQHQQTNNSAVHDAQDINQTSFQTTPAKHSEQVNRELLKQALEGKEKKHQQDTRNESTRQGETHTSFTMSNSSSSSSHEHSDHDEDNNNDDDDDSNSALPQVNLDEFDDADDPIPENNGSDGENGSDSDDSDDSDDEEAELARELELIRKEREEQKLRQLQAEAEEAERKQEEALLASNPLLGSNNPQAGGLKRRWDDDVVFKNQARGDVTNKPKKRFINDTIRSDFHRNFINKYIQ